MSDLPAPRQRMTLTEWAQKWHLPPQALQDLCSTALHLTTVGAKSETRVQSEIRLAAARKDIYLFRNNVGAGKMASGSFVRFGLANDSEALNDKFKSADLIGIERVAVTSEMVGGHIGRFVSVECKRENWKFSGTLEEYAQLGWASLINAQGGRAIITNTPSSI